MRGLGAGHAWARLGPPLGNLELLVPGLGGYSLEGIVKGGPPNKVVRVEARRVVACVHGNVGGLVRGGAMDAQKDEAVGKLRHGIPLLPQVPKGDGEVPEGAGLGLGEEGVHMGALLHKGPGVAHARGGGLHIEGREGLH